MTIDFYRLRKALGEASLMILIIVGGAAGFLGLLFGTVWLLGPSIGLATTFILFMLGAFTWILY